MRCGAHPGAHLIAGLARQGQLLHLLVQLVQAARVQHVGLLKGAALRLALLAHVPQHVVALLLRGGVCASGGSGAGRRGSLALGLALLPALAAAAAAAQHAREKVLAIVVRGGGWALGGACAVRRSAALKHFFLHHD